MNGTFKVLIPLILVLSFISTNNAAPRSVEDRNAKAQEVRRLSREFGELYRASKWDKAIEVGTRLAKLAPETGTNAYNLACVYSLNNRPDEAALWLIESANNGFDNLRLLTTDTDLDAVRSHADYKKAVSVIRQTQEKAIAHLRELFEETTIRIVEPPNYDETRPVPAIVALHGYGGTSRGVVAAWRKTAAEFGALLVAPNAVYPGPGVGYTWASEDRVRADEAEHLVRWTVELILRDYQIDENRIVLTGFSQGGSVSLAVGSRQPYAFAGVIPMAGQYVRALDAPQKATGDRAPRFFFMAGADDELAKEMRQARTDFARAGFITKLRIYPNVGHAFPPNSEEELKRALDFVLGQ